MRIILLVSAALLLILGGFVGAVRAGSATATPHLAWLLTNPDGTPCEMPCVLGVLPRRMTLGQAANTLRRHPFVADLDETFCNRSFGICEFRLRGFPGLSGLMRGDVQTEVIDVYIAVTDSRTLVLGDFLATLGQPTQILPHYSCCEADQLGPYLSRLERLSPTYGFLYYFGDKGFAVMDIAEMDRGMYRMLPESRVLGFRVFQPQSDDIDQEHWDGWHGFTTLARYFALAR